MLSFQALFVLGIKFQSLIERFQGLVVFPQEMVAGTFSRVCFYKLRVDLKALICVLKSLDELA